MSKYEADTRALQGRVDSLGESSIDELALSMNNKLQSSMRDVRMHILPRGVAPTHDFVLPTQKVKQVKIEIERTRQDSMQMLEGRIEVCEILCCFSFLLFIILIRLQAVEMQQDGFKEVCSLFYCTMFFPPRVL
jgi:hypothetical protein